MTNQPKEEILIAERDFDTIFSYDAGATRSKFLIALRDEQKILGTRCPTCHKVYVPAQTTCLTCFSNMSEFVEVGNEGTLVTYTTVNVSQPYYPAAAPFVYGIIKLDKADTGLVHLIGGIAPEKIQVGMRLKAVFSEQRTGHIKDIQYFKPV